MHGAHGTYYNLVVLEALTVVSSFAFLLVSLAPDPTEHVSTDNDSHSDSSNTNQQHACGMCASLDECGLGGTTGERRDN